MLATFRRLCCATVLVCPAAALASDVGMIKITVGEQAVFRVTDRSLRESGAVIADGDAARLRLRARGKEVAIRFEPLAARDADGRFRFDFVGSAMADGPGLYLLDVAPASVSPMRLAVAPLESAAGLPVRTDSDETVHAEQDAVSGRTLLGSETPVEGWYWTEIATTHAEPARVSVPFAGSAAGTSFKLRLGLVGRSSLPSEPDHAIEIRWNGVSAGTAIWDGARAYTYETTLPAAALRAGPNELVLRAQPQASGIDAVWLDWVELVHARENRLAPRSQLALQAHAGAGSAVLWSGKGALRVYDTRQDVLFEAPSARLIVPPPVEADGGGDGSSRYLVVSPGGERRPRSIEVTHPADLQAIENGADFLIIAHHSLLPAAERLARARNAEGLRTRVVDVSDVYDRFREGVLDPVALRDFLAYADQHWSPRPRYVLLMGDASRSARHDPNHRMLVPALTWPTRRGAVASDNQLACLGNSDGIPRLAVGRFPVATLAEAEALVDKSLQQGVGVPASDPPALLLVVDERHIQQDVMGYLDEAARLAGYAPKRLQPTAEDADFTALGEAIRRAIDAGPAIVVFGTSGDSHAWTTADASGRQELIGATALSSLKHPPRLPVVLSFAALTAPFDDPEQESIGERLLRLPGRGALAVVATSGRGPAFNLTQAMIFMLGRDVSPRIGDAFKVGIRDANDPESRNTFNLLGDPTIAFKGPLRVPWLEGQPPKRPTEARPPPSPSP